MTKYIYLDVIYPRLLCNIDLTGFISVIEQFADVGDGLRSDFSGFRLIVQMALHTSSHFAGD